MPGGGAIVPLVSTAISNPFACTALDERIVQLQQGFAAGEHDEATVDRRPPQANSIARQAPARRQRRRRPAVGPDEISVAESANGVGAIFLRPDHRLQPEKRQKTAARPAWAPSPCRVRKISFTAYLFMRPFADAAQQKGPLARSFLSGAAKGTQINSEIHFFSSPFGAAPILVAASLPSLNSISVGMLRMP